MRLACFVLLCLAAGAVAQFAPQLVDEDRAVDTEHEALTDAFTFGTDLLDRKADAIKENGGMPPSSGSGGSGGSGSGGSGSGGSSGSGSGIKTDAKTLREVDSLRQKVNKRASQRDSSIKSWQDDNKRLIGLAKARRDGGEETSYRMLPYHTSATAAAQTSSNGVFVLDPDYTRRSGSAITLSKADTAKYRGKVKVGTVLAGGSRENPTVAVVTRVNGEQDGRLRVQYKKGDFSSVFREIDVHMPVHEIASAADSYSDSLLAGAFSPFSDCLAYQRLLGQCHKTMVADENDPDYIDPVENPEAALAQQELILARRGEGSVYNRTAAMYGIDMEEAGSVTDADGDMSGVGIPSMGAVKSFGHKFGFGLDVEEVDGSVRMDGDFAVSDFALKIKDHKLKYLRIVLSGELSMEYDVKVDAKGKFYHVGTLKKANFHIPIGKAYFMLGWLPVMVDFSLSGGPIWMTSTKGALKMDFVTLRTAEFKLGVEYNPNNGGWKMIRSMTFNSKTAGPGIETESVVSFMVGPEVGLEAIFYHTAGVGIHFEMGPKIEARHYEHHLMWRAIFYSEVFVRLEFEEWTGLERVDKRKELGSPFPHVMLKHSTPFSEHAFPEEHH